MRLIDGNKALREVEQIPIFSVNWNKAFREGCRYMQKRALRVLYESKAIEAEPVRHGRWTEIDASYWRWKPDGAHPVKRVKYRHDECGKVVAKKEPYCPHCGAHMKDGERRESDV